MAPVEADAAERVRLARQLRDLDAGFRSAVTRRDVARRNRDTVGEDTAAAAIEAAFQTRDVIRVRLRELGTDLDAEQLRVRRSRT
jgi:hypothetical protein